MRWAMIKSAREMAYHMNKIIPPALISSHLSSCAFSSMVLFQYLISRTKGKKSTKWWTVLAPDVSMVVADEEQVTVSTTRML